MYYFDELSPKLDTFFSDCLCIFLSAFSYSLVFFNQRVNQYPTDQTTEEYHVNMVAVLKGNCLLAVILMKYG